MSLSFTAPSYASHYTVLEYKASYLFGTQSSKYEAWYDGIASPTAEEDAAYAKYSGKTMSIIVERSFLPSFQGSFNYEFQNKWSGACFEDYSSSVGGFCLLEETDNAMTTSSTAVTDFYTGSDPYTLTTVTTNTMEIYRVAKSVFATFDTLWADSTAVLSDNSKDGRIYYSAVVGGLVDTSDSNNIEYLDYPACAKTESGDDNYWSCQMYLPKRSQQSDGYPRFDTPGVITVYYVASMLPGSEEISYTKTTQIIDGAMSTTTYAAAIVAAVASLLF